jgi:hypothetical protein
MSEPPLNQSGVVPVLHGPVVCDAAVQDPTSGKWSLVGIFNRVHVTDFPAARPMYVWLRLSDAEGKYHLRVVFVHVDSDRKLAEMSLDYESRSRLGSTDTAVSFPPLPLPEPGSYEFQVWCNNIFLGSGTIMAVQRVKAAPEQA